MCEIGRKIIGATLINLLILSGLSCVPANPAPKLVETVDLADNLFLVAEDESYPIDENTKEYFQSVSIPIEPRLVYMREGRQIGIYDDPTDSANAFSVRELQIIASVLDTIPLSAIEQVRGICLKPTNTTDVDPAEINTDYRGIVQIMAEPNQLAKNQGVSDKSQLKEQFFREALTHEIGHIFQMALMWYTGWDGVAKAEDFAAINNKYLQDPLSYIDTYDIEFNDDITTPYGMSNPPYEDFATIFGAFFTNRQELRNTATRRANNGHPGLLEKVVFFEKLFQVRYIFSAQYAE